MHPLDFEYHPAAESKFDAALRERNERDQARGVHEWNANMALLLATLTEARFPLGTPFLGFDVDAARAHLGELRAMVPTELEAAARAQAAKHAEWLAAYRGPAL